MEENRNKLAFGKKNYSLMLTGIALLILGFVIMSLDTEQYGLGFMGITLGPLVVLAGFAVEFFAIMAKDKKQD
ncbi:DUF3098 domain-containing protein [Pontibacter rugosus]|uniref:DUF3098 domain-containing protein n=1 Tax=Pontibacter rugosus TaxID=1745966 RepID=A0ABW3SQA0_9BACT